MGAMLFGKKEPPSRSELIVEADRARSKGKLKKAIAGYRATQRPAGRASQNERPLLHSASSRNSEKELAICSQ